MDLIEKITNSVKDDVEKLGYRIFKIEYVKESGQRYLRIMIDKDGDITIEDCVKVVKTVNPILDDLDLIDESYTLDVCSKGGENE